MQFTRKIVLSLLIIVLCSAMAFASEESPVPEQAPLEVEDAPFSWVDLEQAAIMKGAEEIKAVSATSYTTDDIYNLLYAALRGTSSSSTYSLPYIGNRLANIYSVLSNQSYGMSSIYSDLHTIMQLLSGTTSGLNPINNINDALYIITSGQSYSQADLTGMIWSIVQDIESDLATLETLSNQAYQQLLETQRTNAKLEYVFSAIEDTINIKWYDYPASYDGTKLTSDGSYLSSQSNSTSFIIDYSFSGYIQPSLVRLSFPVLRYSAGHSDNSQYSITSISASNGNNSYTVTIPEYYILPTSSGLHVYLFGFSPVKNYTYSFTLSSDLYNSTFYPLGMTGAFYIPFDTLDYQIIYSAFNSARSADSDKSSLDQLVNISSQLSTLAHSSQSGADAAEALADYFVSPQKQAAEDASSQVINSTLNNFTGSGSGAAKQSDSNAMKDVSGSLQSGLNSGGSVSGATGVFNSGSDFWGWFSQQNSNYINNPYPAPSVSPTRGSGDEIVDFLTPNSNELQDLLRQGGDQR